MQFAAVLRVKTVVVFAYFDDLGIIMNHNDKKIIMMDPWAPEFA